MWKIYRKIINFKRVDFPYKKQSKPKKSLFSERG